MRETERQRLWERLHVHLAELRRLIHGLATMDIIDTSALTKIATDIGTITTKLEAEPTGAAQLVADQGAFDSAVAELQTAVANLQAVVSPPPPPSGADTSTT